MSWSGVEVGFAFVTGVTLEGGVCKFGRVRELDDFVE